MDAFSADGSRDVAGQLSHPVTLVTHPVRERDVADTTGAAIRGERPEEEEIRALGNESEA
jgi:hypothetical protein